MNTFLKVVGILALCCIGGCVVLGIIGGIAAKKVADDPEFQKAVQEMQQPAKFTLAQFNQIQNGNTLDQVVAILGESGTVQSDNDIAGIKTTMYAWTNPNPLDGNLNVMIQNGKVIQKSQFGLK